MEEKITTGCIVAYKECLEEGDDKACFVVMDDYGRDSDRCKLQALNTGLSMSPVCVSLKKDLKVVISASKVLDSMLSGDEYLKCLGKHLQLLRRKHKLSQQQLAELTGLDRSYLAGVESGKRNVTILNLKLIATALKMRVWALLRM